VPFIVTLPMRALHQYASGLVTDILISCAFRPYTVVDSEAGSMCIDGEVQLNLHEAHAAYVERGFVVHTSRRTGGFGKGSIRLGGTRL
jgi:hypothetical protein